MRLITLLLMVIGSLSVCYGGVGPFVLDVTGLSEEMKNNVLAHLTIAGQKDNPELSDLEYNRLFAKITDEARIALQPFGYYHPIISSELTSIDSKRVIHVNIDPGRPALVHEVEITLEGDGRDEINIIRQQETFPLRKGDVLDHRKYEVGKQELFTAALERGYRKAGYATSRVQVDTRSNRARIHLVLNTGKQFLFGPITFSSDSLDKGFLRRLLPVDQGDPFSPQALAQLRQALLDSGYFREVKLVYELDEAEDQSVPVHVVVKAAKTKKYGLGVGYGTDTGFRGTAEWANRHLNRYGHQFSVKLQPSERKSSYSAAYTVPISNPKKERISILGKWENENYDNTDTEAWSLTAGYDLIKEAGESSIYLSYLDEDYTAGVDEGRSRFLTPGIQIVWRFADDRILTGNGVRLAMNLTGGSDEFLSDASFFQGAVRGKGIVSPVKDWRVISRFEAGGSIVDDIYDLPPSFRYYAGGDQSVRGYGYKRIGPKDGSGNVIGGKYLFSYSIELERTLFDRWAAAVFYDSGSAMNSLSDLSMQQGAGVGVRWRAPFGQIRLDVAKGLSDEGGGWRLHFNIGADL